VSKDTKNPKKRKRVGSVSSFGSSVPNQLQKARSYPIGACYITESWQEKGIGNIIITREKPNGMYGVGVYLIDLFCLGLKNTFYLPDSSPAEIESKLLKHENEHFVRIHEDKAHSIIYGGIDSAAKIGFFPHRDFKQTKYVLKSREEIDFDDSIEFGKDGKPFYISGPYENDQDVMKITQVLKRYKDGSDADSKIDRGEQ